MRSLSNVNFLRERVRIQEEVYSRDRKTAFFTTIGLGIFLVIITAVFSYRLYLSKKLDDTKLSLASAENVIRKDAPQIIAYTTVNDRIGLVQTVETARKQRWEAIAYFYSISPPGVSIKSVDLSTQDKTIQLVVSVPSIFSLQDVLNTYESNQIQDRGYTLEFGALSRGKTGSYDISVILHMNTKKT
ncbi:MAG TPA: hypothetical protein VLH19_04315 [Patescibacteria group bacterium]|nr:hypothetical protein [Patescibacteria group bacterium]